nr:metallophosphoesterase [Deltaproteobacteria bacterium]
MTSRKTPYLQRLFDGPIDVVGDVHGELDALLSLMRVLGYDERGEHPRGRRLVLLGDLCDRGPDSPGVLALARRMIEEGRAQAVLGNHELNLLREVPKHGNGWFFKAKPTGREGSSSPRGACRSTSAKGRWPSSGSFRWRWREKTSGWCTRCGTTPPSSASGPSSRRGRRSASTGMIPVRRRCRPSWRAWRARGPWSWAATGRGSTIATRCSRCWRRWGAATRSGSGATRCGWSPPGWRRSRRGRTSPAAPGA